MPNFLPLLLLAMGANAAFGSTAGPWQRWHSPLQSLAIACDPTSNLTTLYPRLDYIVGRSIRMYGSYSPAELHLLSRPEFLHTMVVEVGAHIGALSAAMSRSVGDLGAVISVEPNPYFADMAAANIALNSNARAVVLLSAASNVSKMACLRSAALDKWQVWPRAQLRCTHVSFTLWLPMQVADLKANSVSRFFAAREAAPSVQDDLSSEPGIRTGSYGRRGVTSALPLSMKLEGKGGSREAASGVSIRDALSHNIRECALTEGIYSDTHTLDALLAHAAHILQPPVRGRPHLPALSLIRVDAEGLDGAVVQGAMGVINSQNPVVIFEAEYQDGRNLSHFSKWERTMAEYPAHLPSHTVKL